MKNTIPLSSHITTNDLIGLLIWYLLYVPLVSYLIYSQSQLASLFAIQVLVPPEKLQKPFIVSSIAFVSTILGLTIWSVHTNGGGGPLFHTPNTAPSTSWSMIFGITSILGSWGCE